MAELYMEQIVPENIAGIKPYEPGKPLRELEREYNISDAVKLASNENPAGFSPGVQEAVMRHLKDMNRYPESFPFELASRLAEKFAVTQQNIVVGNGSDDIIALLAHGFLEPGQEDDHEQGRPLPNVDDDDRGHGRGRGQSPDFRRLCVAYIRLYAGRNQWFQRTAARRRGG